MLFGLFTIRRRHSQIRKEDHDPSIITYPAHVDVRQDRIPSGAKSSNVENVRIY